MLYDKRKSSLKDKLLKEAQKELEESKKESKVGEDKNKKKK